MSTLKVDTIKSDTLPTVAITDGLVVSGVSTFHDVVNIETDDNNALNIIDTTASFRPSINFKKNDSGTVSTLMQIRAEGTNGLDIKDGSGNLRLRVDSSGEIISYNGTLRRNVSDSSFTFTGDTASNTGSNISVYGASHSTLASVVRFRSGATETVRIDSSGRLLVGTTSNTSPIGWGNNLQVAGTSAVAGISIRRDEDGTGGALLVFGKSRGSLNGNTVVQSGDQIGGMYFAGADGTDVNSIAAQISVEVDTTPGSNDMPGRILFKTTADGAASPTERLRIDKDGTCKFDPSAGGTLSITGSSAHTSKIIIGDNANTGAGNCLVEGGDGGDYFTIQSNGNVNFASGNGITFADSSTSAVLDDYEEGTWTPAFSLASGAVGSYSYQYGKYIKIGKICYCTFRVQADDGNGDGATKISGLPFASADDGQQQYVGQYYYYAPGALTGQSHGKDLVGSLCAVDNNATTMSLYALPDDNEDMAPYDLDYGVCSNSLYIRIMHSFSYKTAA